VLLNFQKLAFDQTLGGAYCLRLIAVNGSLIGAQRNGARVAAVL